MQGIFLKQAARVLEMATGSEARYGVDKSPEVAMKSGYHTTVTPWIEGENGEQVLVLRDCILRHCFRELDTMDEHEWQHPRQKSW